MVRNMALIVLLIMGALFAAFYLPNNIMEGNNQVRKNPVNVSYRIPESVDSLPEKEVFNIADDFDIKIQNYREIDFIELLSSGINRDNVDEKGKIIEQYENPAYYRQFISDKELNNIMGTNLAVQDGTYKMICSDDMEESVFFAYDDLDYVQNLETGLAKNLRYDGTVILNELIVENGWDTFSRFVISEKDYQELKAGISDEHIIRQVLFNVDHRSCDFRLYPKGISRQRYKYLYKSYRAFCDRWTEWRQWTYRKKDYCRYLRRGGKAWRRSF